MGTAKKIAAPQAMPSGRGAVVHALYRQEQAGDGGQVIFVALPVWDGIQQHARSRSDIEVGGILLGSFCRDGEQAYLEVAASLAARYTEERAASLTFTHRTWNDFNERRNREHPGLRVVGWYHTHPGYGVFLSAYDLFIQEHFFNEDGQVAVVIDPVKNAHGFFYWDGETTRSSYGVYLFSDAGEGGEAEAVREAAIECGQAPGTEITGDESGQDACGGAVAQADPDTGERGQPGPDIEEQGRADPGTGEQEDPGGTGEREQADARGVDITI